MEAGGIEVDELWPVIVIAGIVETVVILYVALERCRQYLRAGSNAHSVLLVLRDGFHL